MNNLKIFKNEEFGEVRTVLIGDEPYFVGKDVAEILGYTNSRKAIIDHVELEDKTDGVTICDSLGREQTPVLINESGLYSLIMSSKMPNAKKFKKWVTSEVLPSIRKHGMYATDELIANPDLAVEALKMEYNLIKNQKRIILALRQQILEKTGKISYYDIILNCSDLVTVTRVAKDYGWSVKRLHNYLHEKGVLTKRGKIWLLEHEYVNKGYTKTKVRTDDEGKLLEVNTRWTPAGRLFIYGLLKSDGILPLIERKRG